jgi:hypothetical protein
MQSFATVKTIISIWDLAMAVVSPYLVLWLRTFSVAPVEFGDFVTYGLASSVATLVLLRVLVVGKRWA